MKMNVVLRKIIYMANNGNDIKSIEKNSNVSHKNLVFDKVFFIILRLLNC